MRPVLMIPASAAIVLMTSGCLAKTAFDVVTAPVKLVSKAADFATISQSEADEKRGRKMRKHEEELGKLERQYGKQRKHCDDGDRSACDNAREIYDEMRQLVPGVPTGWSKR